MSTHGGTRRSAVQLDSSAGSVFSEPATPIAAKPRVSDAIVDSLRLEIASGRLQFGAKLPTEKALATRFGVSLPTVREAVRALEVMGLLESRHGSGIYVTRNTSDFVTTTLQTLLQMEQVRMLEVFEVRRTLGHFAAEKAHEHADVADIDRIQVAADSCDSATDTQSIAEAIVEFQVAFAAAARNPLLFALETFLIRLLMQFQLQANGDKGLRFWRRQANSFRTYRHGMIAALRAHDQEELVTQWGRYLSDQGVLFESDPELSDVSLSDPASIRTVDEIVLHMPSYTFGAR